MTDHLVAKVGNLTDHPELRHDQSLAFASFGITCTACVPRGEPQPEPTFYKVSCAGSLADFVATSLQKGDRAVVLGKPEVGRSTGRDGAERKTQTIVAEVVGSVTTAQRLWS